MLVLDVALVPDGASVLAEEVGAPPELLTLDVGSEPTREVGLVPAARVVTFVSDGLVASDAEVLPDVVFVRDGLSVLAEEVRAPPELLTLDVGDEPVGPLLEPVVPDVEVVPGVVVLPDGPLVPDGDEDDVDEVLDDDDVELPDDELVPDAPGVA
ncbi:hypothetical protein [Mycolicibacterium moriokaense]|uniref:Uncharacterized protein n=1 Tax=Mycolicibacterium moriokaense TaxID=39691 RepID=A0A318HSU3_9MYCO|nr:hypothetical protein [Mycolicibacterium moriokaense]PXX12940.1 hypothetical protein C8E89_10188 [Mycolicibacterium moriokaense]